MSVFTPPLTPKTYSSSYSTGGAVSIYSQTCSGRVTRSQSRRSPMTSPLASPDDFALPPPLETVPQLDLPEPSLPFNLTDHVNQPVEENQIPWRNGMTPEERDAREEWIAGGRGRKGLRIVIVTENFLPKVDGVTRTLARLLEHLEREGHSCMLLGPGTGMSHYASHPLVGTAGVPLVVYPGLKLNFLRPKFLRTIKDFQPDVVHFVDPIWLGAQTLMAMELGWAGEDWVGEGGPAIGTGISGAVVASYHTNLATYATLFGMSWLEPIMWRFQRWLYSKALLTLCPSSSTQLMLESQSFSGVRLWPRGVDLHQFGPSKRCQMMRNSWGAGNLSLPDKNMLEKSNSVCGRPEWGMLSPPWTPPLSPVVNPSNNSITSEQLDNVSRVVLLYVGRVSWEKNLILLLKAYGLLKNHLPACSQLPKLVFVGDGPARTELESICHEKGYDATFMGHRQGEELARCYASADIFAFPSFTETFGQVVLEALASGLPVVGLDAEGTRDLVTHGSTGLLLPLPSNATQIPPQSWPKICRDSNSSQFDACADGYAELLARVTTQHSDRVTMGVRASTEGIKGFTWWDAMESCVDGYRESIRHARTRRQVQVTIPDRDGPCEPVSQGASPRISRVNRALSSRLAHRGKWAVSPSPSIMTSTRRRRVRSLLIGKNDTAETLWHLKTLMKGLLVAVVLWWIWTRHLAAKGRVVDWEEVFFVP